MEAHMNRTPQHRLFSAARVRLARLPKRLAMVSSRSGSSHYFDRNSLQPGTFDTRNPAFQPLIQSVHSAPTRISNRHTRSIKYLRNLLHINRLRFHNRHIKRPHLTSHENPGIQSNRSSHYKPHIFLQLCSLQKADHQYQRLMSPLQFSAMLATFARSPVSNRKERRFQERLSKYVRPGTITAVGPRRS